MEDSFLKKKSQQEVDKVIVGLDLSSREMSDVEFGDKEINVSESTPEDIGKILGNIIEDTFPDGIDNIKITNSGDKLIIEVKEKPDESKTQIH